jgi:hypothetical protein
MKKNSDKLWLLFLIFVINFGKNGVKVCKKSISKEKKKLQFLFFVACNYLMLIEINGFQFLSS